MTLGPIGLQNFSIALLAGSIATVVIGAFVIRRWLNKRRKP